MVRRYSRLARTEEKKNIRKAIFYIALTLVSLAIFVLFGLPTIARFAAFLTDIRKSSEPVEKNDTTPPVQPRLEPTIEATNELKIDIKGTTEPGATVTLFLNNKEEEVLADKDGEFSYTFFLNDGANTISAAAKDSSGNESQKTETVRVTYDDDPPALAIIKPEDGSEFYGSKQRQIVIEGTTEPGASININGRVVVVENDGSFAFVTTLSEGENTFNIKAEDQAGNAKETSLTLHFTP